MKYLKFFPLLTLIVLSIHFLISYTNTNLALTRQNYIGLGFMLAVVLLFLIKRRYAFMLTGLILLLGSLSLISITPVVYVFIIKNVVEIDLILFPIFVFYLYIFRKDLLIWINGE